MREKQGALGQQVKILSPVRTGSVGLPLGRKPGEGRLAIQQEGKPSGVSALLEIGWT